MPKKKAILNNVTEYSAKELAEYIQKGIVTLDELCNDTDGDFTAKMKIDVEDILSCGEDIDFKSVMTSGTISDLQDFLNKYPMGSTSHLDAVRQRKKKLESISLTESDSEATSEYEIDTEDEEWKLIKDSDNLELLENFKKKYPGSSHEFELNKTITRLKNSESTQKQSAAILKALIHQANSADEVSRTIVELVKNGTISLQTLIDVITSDHNILSSAACNDIIHNGILSRSDLSKCGIDEEFINKMLSGTPTKNFESARQLEYIAEPCTEVYFWGIPSSGKTCALGAILSAAKSGASAKSMIPDNSCQGFGYMNRLSNVFTKDKICRLPGGTPVTATYEMRFELEDYKGYIHNVACIDMAGELFTCMFMQDAGEQLREEQQMALDTLHNILSTNCSNNKKLHFFVIEYGAAGVVYEGLPQAEYLSAAASHLYRMGLFDKNTDAIYILMSKVDKAKYEGSLEEHLKKYMTKNYRGFYNNLLRIVKEKKINHGNVNIIPFSIGDVCFKDYCRFDSTAASKIVNMLIHYSYTQEKSFFQMIKDLFKLS